MVTPVNSVSSFRPVNEGQGPGLVTYRLGRMDLFNRSQREDAYRQMFEQCSGKYRIDKEWTDAVQEVAGGYIGGTNGTPGSAFLSTDQTQYIHIQFSCVRQE
jgi:hypothetical protein